MPVNPANWQNKKSINPKSINQSRRPAMLKMKLMLLMLVIFVSGCATTGHAPECDVWQPIYIGIDDDLTDETITQIFKHNEKGRKICGW